jgi:F-type H+-transporting ATPase subunit gamma
MASAREVRLRIRSVNNIAQVTRALQTISASRVRKAQEAVLHSRPYAHKAQEILQHLSAIPEGEHVHPLLAKSPQQLPSLVILITSDRGLAGAYNTNILRFALERFNSNESFIAVGRKGRDVLVRLGKNLVGEFSNLPPDPSFMDVSAIGQLAIEEFQKVEFDRVFLVYTDYINLLRQDPTSKQFLPLELEMLEDVAPVASAQPASYIYEPGQRELLDLVLGRFIQLQLYEAFLESLASEHAARMVAMQNATENAVDLSAALTLKYNKARQLAVTSDMLDIVGGAEALTARSRHPDAQARSRHPDAQARSRHPDAQARSRHPEHRS